MVKHLVMLALAIFLVSASVQAADINSTVTLAELQQTLDDLEAVTQTVRTDIVTVRLDMETQQLFTKLDAKMSAMEQRLNVFEERFISLKGDISDKIESSSQLTISGVNTATDTKINESHTETQRYVRDMTNPIRINLPNLALWLMVTALFMLTAGLRMKTAVKDAKKEIEENKAVSEEWLK